MAERRKQFTFYSSYYDAIQHLKKTDQHAVLMAICGYAIDGTEPKLTGAAASAFILIRPTLDTSRRKAENGKRGGSSKQNESKPEANDKQPAREKEIEIEIEKENEIEIEKESYNSSSDDEEHEPTPAVPYEEVRAMYNRICVSFPKCTVMSTARQKAIKARFNSGYGLDDFQRLFTKAEASSFLKGQNDRNWAANFDWLTKDSNMAKVLDGNYDNTKGGNNHGSNAGNTGGSGQTQRYGTYL